MTAPSDEEKQAQRAQAASLMLPWNEMAGVLADDAGVPVADLEEASDDFLIDLMQKRGLTREAMCEAVPELNRLSAEQRSRILDFFALEKWLAENVRRAVREEPPLPAGLLVGGVWVDLSQPQEPKVWAVGTAVSDPDALASIFVRQCRDTFGRQAFKNVSQHSQRGRQHGFSPEELAAMHERKMSYKEIAIQTLRSEHPEIIEHPEAFRQEIRTERARIVKVIAAAHRLWKDRMPGDSIG